MICLFRVRDEGVIFVDWPSHLGTVREVCVVSALSPPENDSIVLGPSEVSIYVFDRFKMDFRWVVAILVAII